MSPAVACVPAGGVCRRMSSLTSSSEAAALLQGEEGGRPGAMVLSNPADGRAMPLVRGEGKPGGVSPGEILGCAVASWQVAITDLTS